ncbi:aldo/keto reductase [Loigolactobacillus zhaoyuanensis]|uniref:aldo/keto reductase n=1 Tax=Loigolactobacillus zhaoyuanensis TaxID=2486017 RepID=UPI000F73C4B8|nr:aldo/keto reductase [Loigolactobacillus zhaoyuanensis]
MTELLQPKLRLADGHTMPQLGFGVYKLADQATMNTAIAAANRSGYHLFDTAQAYGNEAILGTAFKELTIPRTELFIITKVAEVNQGYDNTLRSVERSLKLLQTDYLDLLLVHWPIHSQFFETWRAFERLKAEKIVRSIGVSNYHQTHLDYLATRANEQPVVNQIENHPYLSQEPLLAYDRKQQIVSQAWSPLGRGVVLQDPVLAKIASQHHRSVAQIILRWHIQRGLAIIPKSQNPQRISENAAIFDFKLDADEMTAIARLNRRQRTGADPEVVYEIEHQYH